MPEEAKKGAYNARQSGTNARKIGPAARIERSAIQPWTVAGENTLQLHQFEFRPVTVTRYRPRRGTYVTRDREHNDLGADLAECQAGDSVVGFLDRFDECARKPGVPSIRLFKAKGWLNPFPLSD